MIRKTHCSLLKGINWILAGILSVLGFSGCDQTGLDEYGTPYAKFSIHGKVTGKDGKPVKNINVKLLEAEYIDSIYTNVSGDYLITAVTYPEKEFNIIASDVDGELNGSYQNDTVRVKITEKDYYEKGNGNWNHGSADKEVNIALKEKE